MDDDLSPILRDCSADSGIIGAAARHSISVVSVTGKCGVRSKRTQLSADKARPTGRLERDDHS